jgi:hypothetical protein
MPTASVRRRRGWSASAAEGALREDYSPMQEHKKDAETSEDYTSEETDPNKRTVRLIVSAIKIENTWDKCHQTDSDKDQTGDEFMHSTWPLRADFLRYLLQYDLWYFPNRQYSEICSPTEPGKCCFNHHHPRAM